MFDIWLEGMNIAVFTLVVSVMVVLPVQLLLCFKVKSRIIRLLPVIIFSLSAGGLVLKAQAELDWYGLGYMFLALYVGFLVIVCGVGWGIWAVISFWKRKKQHLG